MLLLCSIFSLKELVKVKNARFFFFFENAKTLGQSDEAKWRKK